MTQLATKSKSQLWQSAQRARNALSRAKDEAEKGMRRGVTVAAMPAGAYATCRVIGWAEREQRNLTIGDSKITYMLPVGGLLAAAGAFASTALGEWPADILLGLGGGMISGEAALAGYRHGLAPKQ
jgi:hypothetical protein